MHENRNITRECTEKLRENFDKYFSEDFIKSKPFKDIVIEIMRNPVNEYIVAILTFNIIRQVAENIKDTPELYLHFCKKEQKQIKFYVKKMRKIIKLMNYTNNQICKICDMLKS